MKLEDVLKEMEIILEPQPSNERVFPYLDHMSPYMRQRIHEAMQEYIKSMFATEEEDKDKPEMVEIEW